MSNATKPELVDIQKLQFSNKAAAEQAMLAFLREQEDDTVSQVELLPKPESLNSISGFVTYANGERYFFKSHVEENELLDEYYNAESLSKAGYPMVVAKQITKRVGKQIALYEIVSFPTLFDLVKVAEDKAIAADKLIAGQQRLDKQVFEIYANTLEVSSAEEQANAPINQLFSHRLSKGNRVDLFYKGKQLELDGTALTFEELAACRWQINGVRYEETLNEIVRRSVATLAPVAGPTVVGHGDAHNGNVFVDETEGQFYLFDPAFAGRHDPLLDLVKPLFHNVFARWMYYPEQVSKEVELSVNVGGGVISIEHNFVPSSIKLEFMQSKVTFVLKPLVQLLRNKSALRSDWIAYLRSALFCCPFLTVNLFANHVPDGTLAERYNLQIKLLGLCMAIELGATRHAGDNAITSLIDEIFSSVDA